jgi:hypothetical protein
MTGAAPYSADTALLLGKTLFYPDLFAGNPCNSIHVERFLSGYEKKLTDWGYRPTSARPWKEDNMAFPLHAGSLVRILQGVEHVCTARDALIMSCEWDLGSRGHTATSWRLSQMTLRPAVAPAPFAPVGI